MTTKNIRALALLTSCLTLGACAGDDPKDKPKAPQVVSALSRPEIAPAPKPNVEALTATAPMLPRSVADAPAAEKKPEVEIIDQFDFSHDEPEASAELPDFGRSITAAEVKVDRFVLANGVDKREPVGESDLFSTDTKRIFAFVQLENETAPYSFEVHFEKVEGPKSLYGVKLDVPTAERYRTWAWTQIRRSPGQYRAVLRTREGEEIASREFTIEEAAKSE